jgi:ribosome-associated heat shock protein Hsp15
VGAVKLNGGRVKPSKVVGGTIEVAIETIRRRLAVIGVAERRGPAKVAAMTYAEKPASRAARDEQAEERRLSHRLGADLGTRPTKQAKA